MKDMRKNQSGRSMIEMLGVLAIVGVLSAGGIAGYSMAMQSYKTTQLIEKVNLIATRTRSIYKNNIYTGFSYDNLIKSGKLNSKDLENPFGGNFTLRVNGQRFVVQTDYNIPAEACVDILTADWGDTGVFDGFDVDSNDYLLHYDNGQYPVSTATAVSICKDGGKEIEFFFR